MGKKFFNFEYPKRKRVREVLDLGVGVRNKILEIVNLFNKRSARIIIANSIYKQQDNRELSKFCHLIDNNKVKFISTDIPLIAYDKVNQIEPNMKYITKILLKFEKCLLTQKLSKLSADRFVKRIENNLNQIKSKRTYNFIHDKLFSLYFQYKLNL